MTVAGETAWHGPYRVSAIRVDGNLKYVYVARGEGVTAGPLNDAADLIDQSLAFNGCERKDPTP